MILVELMNDVAPELCLFIIPVFDNEMTSNSLRGPYADSTEECYGQLQNYSGLEYVKCCSLLCVQLSRVFKLEGTLSSPTPCWIGLPLSASPKIWPLSLSVKTFDSDNLSTYQSSSFHNFE